MANINIGSVFPRRSRGTMNLQATFRLEPQVPYNKDKCDLVLKEVIDAAMGEYQYNAKQAPIVCNSLADEIKKRVKELEFDRYFKKM